MTFSAHRFCVAPMLDWTDRHCRFFHRQLTQHAMLYTEMITTGALIYREPGRFLDYNAAEHPVALQLGGSDPKELAHCAKLAEEWGYDEVNLNVGCPSDRVQNGRFGACLMGTPEVVAESVAAMKAATKVPITVKHRIGIDEQDSYEELHRFVQLSAEAGCETFIVHARKAWLQGLSPKENRDVPPLKYDVVYQLKQDFPQLNLIINGGITTLDVANEQLEHVDGVMIGREVYSNPWLLQQVDTDFFNNDAKVTHRSQVIDAMIPYIEEQLSNDIYLSHITRHMLGLYQGLPGARAYRRHLSENATKKGANLQVLLDAVALVTDPLD
jgi:tRNA-dihydrouridine synthase A